MGVRRYATAKEAREAKRVRNRIASRRRTAAAALAAGREPGRRGGQVKYRSDEERRAARYAAVARWRLRNLAEVRKDDAERRREKLRLKSIAEGRTPGVVGRERIFTDDQRREKRRVWTQRWRENNPDRARALWEQQYAANKYRYAQKSRERRLKLKLSGEHTAKEILELWELQKRRCVFCLKGLRWGKFEIDHHIPLLKGGANDRSNLRLLHPRCNRSKGARDPAEHALRNGLLCW